MRRVSGGTGADGVVTVLVHRDANSKRMHLHSVATKESLLNRRGSGADVETSERTGSSSAEGIPSVSRRLHMAGRALFVFCICKPVCIVLQAIL